MLTEKRGLEDGASNGEAGASAPAPAKRHRWGEAPAAVAPAPAVQPAVAAIAPAPLPPPPPGGPPAAALGAAAGAGAASAIKAKLEAIERAKQALKLQKAIIDKVKANPQLASQIPLPGAAPAAPAAAAVPSVTPQVLLGTQKAAEIAAKLGVPVSASPALVAALPKLAPPAAAPPGLAAASLLAGTASVGGPRPLRLDAQGREIDENGNVIQAKISPPTSLKVNQQLGTASVLPKPAAPAVPAADQFFDPDLGNMARKMERRRRAGFDFVHEGKFQREAEIIRLKAVYGEKAFRRAAGMPGRMSGPVPNPNDIPIGGAGPAGGADMDPNKIPLGPRAGSASREGTPAPDAAAVAAAAAAAAHAALPRELQDSTPEVEWWDRGLLAHASYAQDVSVLELSEGGNNNNAGSASAAAAARAATDTTMADGSGAADGQQQQGQQQEGGSGGDATMAEGGEDEEDEESAESRAAKAIRAEGVVVVGGVRLHLKPNKVTHYVEHPVPLEPPSEAPPPPPQPLKLTKKELKKLRTQRRQAREKEKQELIRQGLLEPPKPKVRISNLHRVLGQDAALDPTAIDKEVRKQMAERQAAHEDRNEARKLTPAERHAKKLVKLFGADAAAAMQDDGEGDGEGGADAAVVEHICSVYRVTSLASRLNSFKVDINAKENHMTGVILVGGPELPFSLVVVEGCPKATKRYAKLMLRRIDWTLKPAKTAGARGGPGGALGDADDEDEEEEDEDGEAAAAAARNRCDLVWQGVIKARAYRSLRRVECNTLESAKAVLDEAGLAHVWDAAAAFNPEEAPPVTLV